jgi:hypothetical protein
MWRMMQIGALVQVRLFLAYDDFIFTVLLVRVRLFWIVMLSYIIHSDYFHLILYLLSNVWKAKFLF